MSLCVVAAPSSCRAGSLNPPAAPSAFQISFFHSEYGAGGLNGDAAVAVAAAGAVVASERQSVTVDANLKFQN